MPFPLTPLEGSCAAGALALGLAAGGGVAYASRWPTSQIFGQTLLAGNDSQELALTFDDGPNERYTQEILEYLANYRVRATFFMLGKYVREQPRLAREVHAAGHLVGNHSMTHPNLFFQPLPRVRQQLADCTALLEDTLGMKVRYFRPPYGGRRPAVLRAVRELGLTPVLWNAAGYDWRRSILPETIYRNLQRSIRRNQRDGRGSNLLLHDGGPARMGTPRSSTTTAVPMLIHRLRGEGFCFVTVDHWDKDAPAGLEKLQ